MKSKTLLALSIILTSAATTKAQVQKGSILLGATFGYYSDRNNSSDATSSNTNLSPRISLAIGNNSILGLRTTLGYQSTKVSGNNAYKNSTITLGSSLFWRRLIPIKNQLGWFLEADGGISYTKQKNKLDDSEYKTTNYAVSVVPGFYYQPIPKLLLNVDFGGVGYIKGIGKNRNATSNSTLKSSSVYLSLLNSFTFGVDFILGGRS